MLIGKFSTVTTSNCDYPFFTRISKPVKSFTGFLSGSGAGVCVFVVVHFISGSTTAVSYSGTLILS